MGVLDSLANIAGKVATPKTVSRVATRGTTGAASDEIKNEGDSSTAGVARSMVTGAAGVSGITSIVAKSTGLIEKGSAGAQGADYVKAGLEVGRIAFTALRFSTPTGIAVSLGVAAAGLAYDKLMPEDKKAAINAMFEHGVRAATDYAGLTEPDAKPAKPIIATGVEQGKKPLPSDGSPEDVAKKEKEKACTDAIVDRAVKDADKPQGERISAKDLMASIPACVDKPVVASAKPAEKAKEPGPAKELDGSSQASNTTASRVAQARRNDSPKPM